MSPSTSSRKTRPRGDLDQNRKLLRLAHARLQTLPRIFRLGPVGVGRGKDLHLLTDPLAAPAFCEVGGQRQINVTQVGYVGDRISELGVGQWPPRPVRESIRFV